jgi:aminoglycoside 2'-N-acetyltransferase I
VRQHDRVIDVQLAHTSSLEPATLDAIRCLVEDGFDGHFDETDWEHTLGGMHAIVVEDDTIVAHGAVVQRRLLHGDRVLRTGYVEAVAVRADRRRRGYGRAVMSSLDGLIRAAYELGALSAADDDAARLYGSLGWRRWEGRTWVMAPGGLRRTPDDDASTYVLPLGTPLDFAGDLACDWRDGDAW